MNSIISKPAKTWQIAFISWPSLTNAGLPTHIDLQGVVRGKPLKVLQLATIQVRERMEFSAEIDYLWQGSGITEFQDTDPNEPIRYRMNAGGLQDLFKGLKTGKFVSGPNGISGRFTFSKVGACLLTVPII